MSPTTHSIIFNALNMLNLIQFFLNLQLFLIVLIIYNLLLLSISEFKLEEYSLKILPLKIVNWFLKYLKFSKKTIKFLIICLLILLLISNIYSFHYLNNFILNLDKIIDLYLK